MKELLVFLNKTYGPFRPLPFSDGIKLHLETKGEGVELHVIVQDPKGNVLSKRANGLTLDEACQKAQEAFAKKP